jgi:hypothetical protein
LNAVVEEAISRKTRCQGKWRGEKVSLNVEDINSKNEIPANDVKQQFMVRNKWRKWLTMTVLFGIELNEVVYCHAH